MVTIGGGEVLEVIAAIGTEDDALDFNNTGIVDVLDLVEFMRHVGQTCPVPEIPESTDRVLGAALAVHHVHETELGSPEIETIPAGSVTYRLYVEVNATADNAQFYSFTFSENGSPTTVENEAGSASYTYAGSGTYNIIIRAHKNAGEFIFTSETVVVDISIQTGDDGLPVNGYSTPTAYPGYTLVWGDEFDGDQLGDDWVYEIGTGNWG